MPLGVNKGQLGKDAQAVQEFCGQVPMRGEVPRGDEMWLNIKEFLIA